MKAISCIGIHPIYVETQTHKNDPICVEDYVIWASQNGLIAPQALCRNETEFSLAANHINRLGFPVIRVDGNVPDEFEGWAFVEPVNPSDLNENGSAEFNITEEGKKIVGDSLKDAMYGEKEEKEELWGYYKYLQTIGGSERHDFDTPDEAYAFGQKIRDNIAKECYTDKITVSISNTVVRVKIIA